ncbi:MAG: endolytic transglycosylase MltG [Bacteroidetes bacterium]|jgi:UPF0755 protein|nr:endolytic transglycosylase MltG [Bacteroidota bacterium]
MKDLKRPLAMAGAVILVIAALVTAYVFWWPNPSFDESGTVVTIPRGSSFRQALDSLEAAGAIRSRWAFTAAARFLGADRKVHVGRYRFEPGMSNTEILEDLSSGASRMLLAVTIPEGWRMGSIARRFSRVLGTDSAAFVSLCRDQAFVRKLGIDAPHLEGYLLPETYEFYWQTDEADIVRAMVGSFKAFYGDSLVRRQQELKLTLNQVLSLAAIVEGESSIDVERPIIAGVYWNRLRKRMRLEADPTIQYILPDGPRRLLYEDLRLDSPYNTYRTYGLPPGPINSPGRAAIVATLYPAKHDYIFFVATGNGGHRFTTNYQDHLRAVRSFRQVRRQQQASAS